MQNKINIVEDKEGRLIEFLFQWKKKLIFFRAPHWRVVVVGDFFCCVHMRNFIVVMQCFDFDFFFLFSLPNI